MQAPLLIISLHTTLFQIRLENTLSKNGLFGQTLLFILKDRADFSRCIKLLLSVDHLPKLRDGMLQLNQGSSVPRYRVIILRFFGLLN